MSASDISSIIYDVDLAVDIKSFIINNLDSVSFSNNELKNTILTSKDDDILRVGKTINSPMNIVSVDKVDVAFFRKNLFKDGNKD